MKALGIDLGKVRIGVGVLDWETSISTPRSPIEAIGTLTKDAALVDAVARKEEVELIVLGLPLENGEEGKMANVVRRFGGILEELGWKVAYADETLSSYESDTAMLDSGMKASQRKKRLDSAAACEILDRYRRQA